MVLPSNDYFVANGNPFAHDLSALLNGGVTSISFNIGAINTVNDAGTEINDFANSPGNGIAGAGVLPAGNPLLGDPENGVVTNVIGDPFAGFLNSLLPLPGTLNFNDITQYKNGIATITISVVAPSTVPVPAALPLVISALGGLFAFGRRRQQK